MTILPSKATGNGCHRQSERGLDLYQTPPVAVRALLAVEKFSSRIWEPACGPGSIVGELVSHGYDVVSSDIHDYGWGHHVGDFLSYKVTPTAVRSIITNPPFMRTMPHKFARHAHHLGIDKTALLLRLGYLEGARRKADHENGSMSRVYVFSRRLPMMHREGWSGNRSTSAMAFCWVVWDRLHDGPPLLKWLDWKDYE